MENQLDKPVDGIGQMCQKLLEEYHHGTYNRMMLSGEFRVYLLKINMVQGKDGYPRLCHGKVEGTDEA